MGRPALSRFLRYTLIGVSTFVLDLLLLFMLTEVFGIYSILASGIAYILAISLNYYLSRTYVFVGSMRGITSGYVYFMLIALLGLLIVMGGMYALVSLFHFNYLFARVCIAGIAGFWNFMMNLYVNFKIGHRE